MNFKATQLISKFSLCLLCIALLWIGTIPRLSGGQTERGIDVELDPEKPAPRDLVLNTLQKWIALPPEVHIHWEKAVDEGRVSRNVQILKEQIHGLQEDLPPRETTTLPDGREVDVFFVESLGPNLGANVKQKDLDKLLPDMIDALDRVETYAREQYGDPDPRSRVRFRPEDFGVSVAHLEERPGTEFVKITREGGSREYFVEREKLLNGSHVKRAREIVYVRGNPQLYIQFNKEGGLLFAQATRESVGGKLALSFQGEVISVLRVPAEITGGSVMVTGMKVEQIREIIEAGNRRFFKAVEADRIGRDQE